MKIGNNPFQSDIFQTIWAKHFCRSEMVRGFDFIKGVKYCKAKYLPIYISLGRNLTKGNVYGVLGKIFNNDKGVLLTYDVHGHYNAKIPSTDNAYTCYRITQYPGFLISIDKLQSLSDYLGSNFSKSSRYKLNKYKKRLEFTFDISYTMYHGEISKTAYDKLFEAFRRLLVARFEDKKITNNNLDDREWHFYKEVAFPMILDKKAALFVIYDGERPIGITLNYIADDVLIDAITVFDITYSKFHLGSVTIMKLIEWCIENKMTALDFSKGDFDYKRRWANTVYNFEYHILFPKKIPHLKLYAVLIKAFFEFKFFLRERKLNMVLHKLKYRLLHSSKNVSSTSGYKITTIEEKPPQTELQEIANGLRENKPLMSALFEFLYLNKEVFNELKIYSAIGDLNVYYVDAKSKSVKVELNQIG